VSTIHGKPEFVAVDATEKVYADYKLTVTNPGGHSSLPVPDNAIYHLADGLGRLEHFQFPFELNNVTRAYYQKLSTVTSGQRGEDMKAILKNSPDLAAVARLSCDPIDNSTTHTTCVATRLNAGHANNALPQTAQANVNCRILPGHSSEEVRQTLIKVLADSKIGVEFVGAIGGNTSTAPPPAPPPLRPDVFRPLEAIAQTMWPGAPVIPDMATGASDGKYTNAAGMPTYGISGEAIDRDDIRAHGKDERVRVQSFYDAVDFYYRFLKAVTSE